MLLVLSDESALSPLSISSSAEPSERVEEHTVRTQNVGAATLSVPHAMVDHGFDIPSGVYIHLFELIPNTVEVLLVEVSVIVLVKQ